MEGECVWRDVWQEEVWMGGEKWHWIGMRNEERDTYMPNKNAKGILLLLPDAVMIAELTKGPMNADVFPTCVCIPGHVSFNRYRL